MKENFNSTKGLRLIKRIKKYAEYNSLEVSLLVENALPFLKYHKPPQAMIG